MAEKSCGARAPSLVSKVTPTTASLGNGLNSARSRLVVGTLLPDGKYQVSDGADEQAALLLPVGPVSVWDTTTRPPSASTTAEAKGDSVVVVTMLESATDCRERAGRATSLVLASPVAGTPVTWAVRSSSDTLAMSIVCSAPPPAPTAV